MRDRPKRRKHTKSKRKKGDRHRIAVNKALGSRKERKKLLRQAARRRRQNLKSLELLSQQQQQQQHIMASDMPLQDIIDEEEERIKTIVREGNKAQRTVSPSLLTESGGSVEIRRSEDNSGYGFLNDNDQEEDIDSSPLSSLSSSSSLLVVEGDNDDDNR